MRATTGEAMMRRPLRPAGRVAAVLAAGATLGLGALGLGACSFEPTRAVTAVAGQIRQSPCGGPVRIDEPACDLPVVGIVEVFDASGTMVGRVRTDEEGRYRVTLAPVTGSHRIRVALGDPPPTFPRCPDARAEVVARQVVTVNISCESGMR